MDLLIQALQPFPMTILLFIIPLFLFMELLVKILRKPFPPGPFGLPIIGSMLMMSRLTHRDLAKLTKKYGGIFHLRMGRVHIVVISDPETARQVLQVKDNIFSNRPATIAISYLTYGRADMAFAHYGPFWRQMRKLYVMRLFSRKRSKSWRSIHDEVEVLVKAIASKVMTPINVGELVFNLTKNITYRAAFGSISQDDQEELIEILQEFSMLFGTFNIADFIPWLGWVVPRGGLNQRLVKARQTLDRFIERIIDDHKKRVDGNRSQGGDGDMVDDLLLFYSDEAISVKESDDRRNAIMLTRDNINGVIMDVIFGGTETVASTIEWALTELMRSPMDLKQVQQELADVVGLHRRVDESDLEKLTFLNCCIKETLRLHPPIPLLLHEASEDSEVAGYRIPARTRVIVNAWAIGRDPKWWDDPESFKPSRFLQEGMPDFKGSNFEFIPFGSGRRSCPGMQLGLYALDLAVAHLLHCFTWDLPEGMTPSDLDMSDVFGLAAPRATRLLAIPRMRLICPLV